MTETMPMTQQERAIYGRMAETMEYFHSSFRTTYKLLHTACAQGHRPANMSMKQFLNTGAEFCHHLETHHSIEEQHIFPHLARRMPAFQKELELLTQHRQIHAGLDKLEAYISECKAATRELRLEEMKAILEGFGDVLWAHLEDEVRLLRPENMRRYWSVEEMRRMPM